MKTPQQKCVARQRLQYLVDGTLPEVYIARKDIRQFDHYPWSQTGGGPVVCVVPLVDR